MEFNEEKALEIIEKFRLEKKTLAVWRTRNKIPDKYNDADFVVRVPISERTDLIRAERAISILTMKEVNQLVFKELVNAPIQDIARGKSTFTQDELIATCKEINRLKIDVVKAIERNNQALLKKLIADVRIKHYVILSATLSENEIKSILFSLNKGSGLDTFTFNKLKDAFAKFAIQLNL